jgi:hypothetical protein
MAVGAAGVTSEVAITGSLNPSDWGQQVKQQVETCKDTLRASGVRGIGQCVSAFAKQHGKLVSGEHRNSDARTNDHGNNGKNGQHEHGGPAAPGSHTAHFLSTGRGRGAAIAVAQPWAAHLPLLTVRHAL